MGLYDFTCYDMIQRNAWIFNDNTAWLEAHTGETISFARFHRLMTRLAKGLQDAGIGKGHRIGVLGKNSLAYFMVYGAAAALGAIVLPVNWRLSSEEVIFNLTDGAPTILFVDNEFQDLIANRLDRIPSVEICHNLGEGGDFGDFAALLDNDGAFRSIDVFSDDGFVIIHTAAVGGRPKGALLTHGNVLCANLHLNYGLGLNSRDVHLNLLPLFHVGGLFMVLNAFHAGALNVNMRKFDVERAVALIEEKKISFMFDFSPILSNILDEQARTKKRIDSLQKILGLDSPETIERYQRLTGGTFFCLYGQTETSSLATMSPYNERPGSAGRPIALADIRLVDEADTPVKPGAVGEIVIRGPMVFKGYWGRNKETARTFWNGWHHTGDLGRFDGDGYLWYEGRKAEKELIKPGGENVYPAEVEKVILSHPAVEKTVVFGVPDPKWKEGVKAVCQLKRGRPLTRKALIQYVGGKIAGYKKPQYVEFVDELPVLPSGAIDRVEAKARFGGKQESI